MFALLAFVAFVIAAVVFFVNAALDGGIENVWGLFFLAVGLALSVLGGGIAAVRAHTS